MNPILLEQSIPHVATVTLNRPAKLNALSNDMFVQMAALWEQLEMDDDVRAIVVTGAGKGFCAGHDLNDMVSAGELPVSTALSQLDREVGALTRLRTMSKPVIAAVNGVATGGGLSIATLADIRIASTTARFGVAFINIDLSSGDAGLSWTLPRIIGYGAASELMLTGRMIDAAEALQMRLVNRVVAPEDLLETAHAIATQIASHHPLALRLTKESLACSATTPFVDSVAIECRLQQLAVDTPEARDKRAAFLKARD